MKKIDAKLQRLTNAISTLRAAALFFESRNIVSLELDNLTLTAAYWWFGQSPKDGDTILDQELELVRKYDLHNIMEFNVFNGNQIKMSLK